MSQALHSLSELYDTTGIPEEMRVPISNLRQWLNEDRGCKPMVTNQDIWKWLEEGWKDNNNL
jgi:hypothetical protein